MSKMDPVVEFEKIMTSFPNGCKIDHLPERSVTIIKHPKKEGVIIELRRADIEQKVEGIPPIVFRLENKKGTTTEVTGVMVSIEAAMALLIGLQDYFTRVEPAAQFIKEEGS